MKKEVLLFIVLIISSIIPLLPITLGDTLTAYVTVSNVKPYIMRDSITIEVSVGDQSAGYMTLSENSTAKILCNGTINDANGYADISSSSGTLYDTDSSNSQAGDDNNIHYTNSTCALFDGSGTTRAAQCSFSVWYYANNATWSCNMTAVDSASNQNSTYRNNTVAKLIALMVPNEMSFGSLNPGETAVNRTNITNTGNINLGIKIYGYANDATTSPNAMNCTAGVDKNISLDYMHYNVTDVDTDTCGDFLWTANYWNLTNSTNEKNWTNTNRFYVFQRQNDAFESKNTTCWALKTPSGIDISGTCKGIISFTACDNTNC